jgi:eukaryotic-like serine/threonine-protein kinase
MKPTTDKEYAPKVRSLFLEALDKTSGPERAAYLDQACGPDAQLRARVEALLQAHDEAGGFLQPPGHSMTIGCDRAAPPECPGTIIGRYKLLEKIGEGGMAVVYMAEQQEPIRRKVALKIIKLGMDTRQVIARFEAERQALALMDHPSIAKVLDAGATETGRPFFVMELVTGVSITEYCDKNNLSTKDRLALFLQVCNAVQHAHQKGIIHRDIKPSNVMVTHHDGKPVPKVIDFGIAKATNQKLTEKTLFTRYAHLIGTPAYMSPEQAELSDLDIDTRSDIYSLGVLLYELLTGTTPFSEEELRQAGYIEMQRVIREQEPVKPSTKLGTLGGTLTDIAKCRNCTPDLLRKAIRGDLDWIVMKSLEKDRVRRYETASGLAEDIRRHLESEPVLARGPSTAYRLGKFLCRHRSQILAAFALAVVAAASGIVLFLWNQDRLQLVEAEGFRHRAILSQAQGQYAEADRTGALETIQPILGSKYVGPQAQLLRAGILVDNRRSDEAVTILRSLLGERREIAGAAHSLLARILWESELPDAQKLKEIEEHRRQAEALLAEKAEAYFQRAMTAPTIKEQVAALDKALQLDATHYESWRLRAFTYYASRKYDRLREDALVMTILRPRDPLGHSLRAVALRELGRFQDALAEYDRAMTRTAQSDPQYVDLATQRLETLLRMGGHDRVIVAAHEALKRWSDSPILLYHLFGALTALGDYDKADAVFQEIVRAASTSPDEFRLWLTKYVFDALQAGRPWHPSDRMPAGAAFLPMVEADEVYHDLAARGHRVITDGFDANWSPDGKKLAFSLGTHGYSGVAVFDLATKETDLLIVPGKYPRWSPDGQYIAFVRGNRLLPIPELVASERKNQADARTDDEVWLMKSDGTEPRRVAHGGWPSWSRDSTRVYYHSSVDRMLYSLSILGFNAEPKPILGCAGFCPSVSPDERRVAYVAQDWSLKVQDLASQAAVTMWPLPAPSGGWSGPAWSPTSNELCLGGGGGLESRTGLWIYRFDESEPLTTLSGQITVGSWAPDGTKLAFELGASCCEIWAADLTPHLSIAATLSPTRTLREHFRNLIALYTRRIDADPVEAANYLRRAAQHQYLREEANMRADMRRHVATLKQGFSSDFRLGGPWAFMHAVDGPFGYQLVVFWERQEDRKQVLRVALGQKGRCEMKSFEIPVVVTSLLGLCLLSGLDTPAARADFTFGKPVSLGPVVNTGAGNYGPCISPAGLELYFHKDPGEMWVTRRTTLDGEWGPPSSLGPTINSPAYDGGPCLSSDGLSLYFFSDRGDPSGMADLWVTTRATTEDKWGTPANLGAPVNTASDDWSPSITGDGLELYFTSNRPGGYGAWDLWVTTRASLSDNWGAPANLGPTINTAAQENWPGISPDGLLLVFASSRPGGPGNWNLYMAWRATRKDPWGPATSLGTVVNSTPWQVGAKISPDGSALYFHSPRSGGFSSCDMWQAPITPIMDFNGDGKVDATDTALLLANWGKNQPLCDIGPYPWGDGIVDSEDLKVLMKTVDGTDLTTNPLAGVTEVRRDVVLSWTRVPLAENYDVYFGTSWAIVSAASRASPLGVLVSQGQPAVTYDPAGLLEPSRTYYWRVDFVIPGQTPTIYKGSVLSFTTEGLTRPIQNITATASILQPSMGPEKTVNGSGLDKNDGHSTGATDMWLSAGTKPNWIQYEFDQVYALHELWVWNSNQPVEPYAGFGAKTVKIEYSTDGTTWTPLAGVPEFARAPGQSGYVHNTTVSFGGISAKFVKLTIEKGWGAMPSVGLSEVRFFCNTDGPPAKP